MYEAYCEGLEKALYELIEAAQPFTSDRIVTETDGTIPLMDRLDAVLKQSRKALKNG